MADLCEHKFKSVHNSYVYPLVPILTRNQLKATYKAVVELKNTSGFTYSDQDGAGIKAVMEDPWKRFIKVPLSILSVYTYVYSTLTFSSLRRLQSPSETRDFTWSTRSSCCSFQVANQHSTITLMKPLHLLHPYPPTAAGTAVIQIPSVIYSSCHLLQTRSPFHLVIRIPSCPQHLLYFLHYSPLFIRLPCMYHPLHLPQMYLPCSPV
jgi:hypothetical protein